MTSTFIKPNPGYCQCSCGKKTRIAKKTRKEVGHRKGEPIPYINGHNRRKRERYKVEDRGYKTPCWIWQLGKTIWGYGTDQNRSAHRMAYENRYGVIPEKLQLDHLCGNRDCINPDHLEPVSGATNVQRGRLAKLNGSQALAIRAMAQSTSVTKLEIAELFDVHPATIFAILRGQTWRNLPV